MLKVATVLPHEPYREYKDVERVYSGSTEIDKILDKNGNVLFAVNKEVEGTPALAYKGKEETNLKNYRIYGQTVDGESVGDRTGNLFDYTKTNRQIHKLRNDDGTINTQTTQSNYFEYYIPVKPNTTYTVKTSTNCPSRIYFSDSQKQWLSRSDIIEVSSMRNYRTFTIPNNCYFIQFQEFDDYRMDETTIILVEGSEVPASYEPYGYKVPVTVSNGTDTLTTPIYLPEPIKMVGDEAEYIDYAEQKQHRVRKNLLPNTATSQTINGVTFTVNSDGSVSCNGQASSLSVYKIPIYLHASTSYILNGCPLGGSNESYGADLRYNDVTVSSRDIGNGINYTCTQTGTYVYGIRIFSGYTCNNLTFYPMIRKADIEDDTYEPYIENTDVDVILPGIAVTAGTNTLTVGTEVQPSNVYLKGRIKEVS